MKCNISCCKKTKIKKRKETLENEGKLNIKRKLGEKNN